MNLPEGLSMKTWQEFKKMRKLIKAPMTPFAEQRILSKLERLKTAGEDIDEVVSISIENDWKGVFPVDKRRKLPTMTTISKTIDLCKCGQPVKVMGRCAKCESKRLHPELFKGAL